MIAAALKKQFESVLGGPLEWQARPAPEMLPSGIREVDEATGGLPRGCLTEIVGPASSGRTSLLLSILAQATAREEICALVDAEDAFDPASAAAAGVRLERLIWVRDRKSTRLNSSHLGISYAVFCLKKRKPGPPGWNAPSPCRHGPPISCRRRAL